MYLDLGKPYNQVPKSNQFSTSHSKRYHLQTFPWKYSL